MFSALAIFMTFGPWCVLPQYQQDPFIARISGQRQLGARRIPSQQCSAADCSPVSAILLVIPHDVQHLLTDDASTLRVRYADCHRAVLGFTLMLCICFWLTPWRV